MFLHLGQNTVVLKKSVIGIFDIDTTTISATTREFLAKAQRDGRIVNVSEELPRSFVVTEDKTVYISQLSPSVLEKRVGEKAVFQTDL